jgi:hypothetical protein
MMSGGSRSNRAGAAKAFLLRDAYFALRYGIFAIPAALALGIWGAAENDFLPFVSIFAAAVLFILLFLINFTDDKVSFEAYLLTGSTTKRRYAQVKFAEIGIVLALSFAVAIPLANIQLTRWENGAAVILAGAYGVPLFLAFVYSFSLCLGRIGPQTAGMFGLIMALFVLSSSLPRAVVALLNSGSFGGILISLALPIPAGGIVFNYVLLLEVLKRRDF